MCVKNVALFGYIIMRVALSIANYSKYYYQEFKDVFNLRSVIHLYLISRFALFIEAKFLLAVVSLESLLSSFEEYQKSNGIQIETGLIKRTGKRI